MTKYICYSNDGDILETFDKWEAEEYCNYKESYGYEVNVEVEYESKNF